jgi:hypothetical protein
LGHLFITVLVYLFVQIIRKPTASCRWRTLRKILGVQRRVSANELIDAVFTGTLVQFFSTIS